MTRGRKPIADFNTDITHINEIATAASNLGAYTVESLAPGLCYFVYGDKVRLVTGKGYMEVKLSTTQIIAEELPDILADYKRTKRDGRVQMDSKAIQRMLRV